MTNNITIERKTKNLRVAQGFLLYFDTTL